MAHVAHQAARDLFGSFLPRGPIVARGIVERVVGAERVVPLQIWALDFVLVHLYGVGANPLCRKLGIQRAFLIVIGDEGRQLLVDQPMWGNSQGLAIRVESRRLTCGGWPVLVQRGVEAVGSVVGIGRLRVLEQSRSRLQVVVGVGQVVYGCWRRRRGRGEGVVVVEVVLEMGLVGYGGRDAVDGGGGDKVGPVVEAVDGVLCVGGLGVLLGLVEMEGVGVGEEVGDALRLDVGQQRLVRVELVVEEAREGVWPRCQSHIPLILEHARRKVRRIQPNGDGSLSPMPVRGSRLPGAPACSERVASLVVVRDVEGRRDAANAGGLARRDGGTLSVGTQRGRGAARGVETGGRRVREAIPAGYVWDGSAASLCGGCLGEEAQYVGGGEGWISSSRPSICMVYAKCSQSAQGECVCNRDLGCRRASWCALARHCCGDLEGERIPMFTCQIHIFCACWTRAEPAVPSLVGGSEPRHFPILHYPRRFLIAPSPIIAITFPQTRCSRCTLVPSHAPLPPPHGRRITLQFCRG